MIGWRRTLISNIYHYYIAWLLTICRLYRLFISVEKLQWPLINYILPPHVRKKSSQSASSSLQHEQHQTSNPTLTQHSSTATAAAVHPHHRNKEAGTSANAGPHYHKLCARVTHIWGNRKAQPDQSAMKGPHLDRTASLITVPPASGKFFVFRAIPQAKCNARRSSKQIKKRRARERGLPLNGAGPPSSPGSRTSPHP